MRQQPIQAGVILKSRFILSKNRKFQEYIDYIDREEAVRNENFEKFSSYNDYMGNPEKTTGLFTADKDSLDEKEKLELKHLFRMAQQNNSIMWQNVISFDNRWLEQHGIIDRKTRTIDEEKFRTAARQSTKIFLDKEGLSASAVWSASIHYNTDNIHIHIAVVEPFPTRERGKVKGSTFTACKSKVVNTIIDYNLIHQKLNQIIRERIVERKKASPLAPVSYTHLTIDIATEKPERARRNISKGMEEQQSRMDHARKESEYRDAEFLKSQYEAMYYEIQKMEDIIKLIHTRVYVAAQTIQGLDEKISRVIRSLEGAGFRAAIMINEVMYDYRSMFLPFDDQDKMPNRRKGQAITGITLGMGLPNHHIMLKDPHGLYWGYTSTSGVVMLDTSHRTKRRLSSSGVIVGDKGSGKSSTLKKSIEHWAVIGDKVRGIATSDEYNSLITELGGKIIYLDRADSMVNPLQIQNVMPREKENFAAHITQMEAFYRCLVPDVTIYELKEFSRLLRRLYAVCGMYDIRSEDEPTKVYDSSAYPVFSDLLALVRRELYQDLEQQILRSNLSDNRKTHLEHIESMLDNLVHTYPFLDAHSTVPDVTEEQIVFYNLGHIRSMAPELFDAQIATVNGLFHNNMYRSQQKYRDGIDNGTMSYDCLLYTSGSVFPIRNSSSSKP